MKYDLSVAVPSGSDKADEKQATKLSFRVSVKSRCYMLLSDVAAHINHVFLSDHMTRSHNVDQLRVLNIYMVSKMFFRVPQLAQTICDWRCIIDCFFATM